jgi:hypothetical protein
VHFLCAKGINAKDIHKEMFRVYCGKCFSGKAVHTWVKQFSQGRSKVADDARDQMRKWLRQQSKDCGFRRAGKAMGQVLSNYTQYNSVNNATISITPSLHDMFRPQTAITRYLSYANTVPLYKMSSFSRHI